MKKNDLGQGVLVTILVILAIVICVVWLLGR